MTKKRTVELSVCTYSQSLCGDTDGSNMGHASEHMRRLERVELGRLEDYLCEGWQMGMKKLSGPLKLQYLSAEGIK
jgi:hypothetical protein